MDDETDRPDITRPNTGPLARLQRAAHRPASDWLAAAWYFAAEAAALLADTLAILLASATVVLRTSHWHGPRSSARS